MKGLIVNADDLALTPSVTRGIVKAHLDGIVTSTTALMNSPHIVESLHLARECCPSLGIGVHLVATEGSPLLPPESIPSLINQSGDFFSAHRKPARLKELNLGQLRLEWEAQIEKFLSFGQKPDHLDSHHHTAYSRADIFKVMLSLAEQYRLPIRRPFNRHPLKGYLKGLSQGQVHNLLKRYSVKSPKSCIISFYNKTLSLENLLDIIASLPEGIHELMCHPGYADEELIKGSSHSKPREFELELFIDPAVKQALRDHHVELVNFSALVG